MSIVILEESVASRIAAGEVVERPASVVKELAENALDAGARRVVVEVRGAGRELIRVSDDGYGMTREDAVLALQRYATSKIKSAEDLFAVKTFGFRGEALPSIAAVSHLTLLTRRPEDEAATRVVVAGGEVVELEEVGAPPGTQVSVSRLFYNTPARLKFLRSDTAEMGHITDVFSRFLFSRPEVAFRLKQGEREVLQHGGSEELLSAVAAAWGRQAAEAMLPVGLELEGMAVRGLVSGPSLHRAGRNREFLYVNGRAVRSRRLMHALEEAYRGVLPERRYPAAVLLVEVDPSAVDVNVHPTKAEVRLSREPEAHYLVLRAVREALSRAGAARSAELTEAEAPSPAAGAGGVDRQDSLSGAWSMPPAAPGVLSPAFQSQAGEGLELRPLAQLRNTYILAESRQGLLVVDQHRAQERVLYERFAETRLTGSGSGQALLTPAVAQLGAKESATVAEQLEELSAVGFVLEAFGNDAYLVRAVPSELSKEDAATLVRDLAEALAEETGENSVARRREKMLITMSCRSAVKAGDTLSYQEMVELMGALGATARPYTCPHGWPIVMSISNFEIDRKFNR